MYVPLYPLESILTFNIGTLCSLPRDTHFSLERVRKIDHMRPQGFERPCRKAIFTRSIFCMSLSGTAGPLRHRKDLLAHNMEVLQTLPSPRSHSCASSHVGPFSKKSWNWFLLLKRCRLVTGLFWGAMDSFAGLFDVFYYINLVKAQCPNPQILN